MAFIKWPTNVGYAIQKLERQFFEVLVELAQGDPSCVQFVYADTSSGRPKSLPDGFERYCAVDTTDASVTGQKLARLAYQERIDFALLFDVQPVHPIVTALREGGVRKIVCYWGAPISAVRSPARLLFKKVQFSLARHRADGLIFESDAMANLAINGRGIPRSMIDVVQLGVDVEHWVPNRDCTHLQSLLGLHEGQKAFVFSGHCTPRKGIHTLIESAIEIAYRRRRTDVVFVLCGNTAQEGAYYESMFKGFGIDKNIRFLGYRDDILKIFQSAYCGIIPSTGWDSFTLSSVEMAATGLPIIASRLQGLAESVLDERTGILVPPGDVVAMADAVVRLADNPALAHSLGDQARIRCVNELTSSLQRQRLLAAVHRHLIPAKTR